MVSDGRTQLGSMQYLELASPDNRVQELVNLVPVTTLEMANPKLENAVNKMINIRVRCAGTCFTTCGTCKMMASDPRRLSQLETSTTICAPSNRLGRKLSDSIIMSS